MKSEFKPQIVTGIAGSHCLVMLYDYDVYIDAKIASPGATTIELVVGGITRSQILSVPDEHAPEKIVQMMREFAHDANV